MSSSTPRFININAGFDENPEPSWKRSWQGEEFLWKVFWGWFFFFFFVILGCSIGFMILAMVLGLVVSPTSLNAGVVGLALGSALVVLIIAPYCLWISVSLWRCAPNCLSRKWAYVTRGFVVIYGITILIPIFEIF